MNNQYPDWQQTIRTAQAQQRQIDDQKAAERMQERKQKELKMGEILGEILGSMGIEAAPTGPMYDLDPYRFHLEVQESYGYTERREYRVYIYMICEHDEFIERACDTDPIPLTTYIEFFYPIKDREVKSLQPDLADRIDLLDQAWAKRKPLFESGKLYERSHFEQAQAEQRREMTPTEALYAALIAWGEDLRNGSE